MNWKLEITAKIGQSVIFIWLLAIKHLCVEASDSSSVTMYSFGKKKYGP